MMQDRSPAAIGPRANALNSVSADPEAFSGRRSPIIVRSHRPRRRCYQRTPQRKGPVRRSQLVVLVAIRIHFATSSGENRDGCERGNGHGKEENELYHHIALWF